MDGVLTGGLAVGPWAPVGWRSWVNTAGKQAKRPGCPRRSLLGVEGKGLAVAGRFEEGNHNASLSPQFYGLSLRAWSGPIAAKVKGTGPARHSALRCWMLRQMRGDCQSATPCPLNAQLNHLLFMQER